VLDFIEIREKYNRNGSKEIYPALIIPTYKKSEDLMIKGSDFYAVWDEHSGRWSTSYERCLALIDEMTLKYAEANPSPINVVQLMRNAENGLVDKWIKYIKKQLRDNFVPLDAKLIFSNTEVSKDNYASICLPYPLVPSSIDNYDKIISTLYSPEERHKIEWCIGAIVSGDSVKLQKFLVFYGSAGTGKSTIINIIQQLFEGYYAVFDAKALGQANNSFALESFKSNPLVAIQHDGDLSHIEDNTRLNSIVSHEEMTVNEKFKATYSQRFHSFLIMGTNRPVRITDAKSGILRRLIDVEPSGEKLDFDEYNDRMDRVKYELGGIAWHCLQVYKKNPRAYDQYVPLSMMGASNDFYNFCLDNFDALNDKDGVGLTGVYKLYKQWCEDSKVAYPFQKRVFKEELKNYFDEYTDRGTVNGAVRSQWYSGFKTEKFEYETIKQQIIENKEASNAKPNEFVWENEASVFDKMCKEWPAQYARHIESENQDIPEKKWSEVTTKLKDLDPAKCHFVWFPEEFKNHIVIDFDIKDEFGNKSLERNIEAAKKWPETYAEVSKGGNGIHLHYIYDGDPFKLASLVEKDVEIKVYKGNSALRRRLSLCNNKPIAHISPGPGLPLRKEDDRPMIDNRQVMSEKGLRRLIVRNLLKDIMPGTKPSIDFIKKILDDAYANKSFHYDVLDMKADVIRFASESTNHAQYCLAVVEKMQFQSEDCAETNGLWADERIMFLDCEVFKNLFIICWKWEKSDVVHKMINPKPREVEALFKYKIVGHNVQNYDNYILYAASMGYSNMALYELSQAIINKENIGLTEAKHISYTDTYDFASAGNKKGLKKWEIELGIDHVENSIPWDQEVPEDRWEEIADYCVNDVLATEAVFNHLSGDFTARLMLAKLSGLTPNHKTNAHTTKIIFGDEKHPNLIYTDFATGEQSPLYPGRD